MRPASSLILILGIGSIVMASAAGAASRFRGSANSNAISIAHRRQLACVVVCTNPLCESWVA